MIGIAAGASCYGNACRVPPTQVVSTNTPRSALRPKSLAIYYGWPSLINRAKSLRQATEVLLRYDWVVLGAGLHAPRHGDHRKTRALIKALTSKKREVFGYIPLGAKTGLSMRQIGRAVNAWREMGVSGIFFDEAGHDFGNDRRRQNQAFRLAHGAGLQVFANAWDPDDLFAPTPGASALRAGDAYLYESFGASRGQAEDPAKRRAKLRKLDRARQRGIRIFGVSTSLRGVPFDPALWRRVLSAARAARLDGVGWGEPLFSAGDNLLPWRPR